MISKYRGKRESGGWVYGSLVVELNHDGVINYIVEFGEKIVEGGKITLIRVISETVGRYTGIDDMNGKEIYKGDVVRRINHYGVSDKIYQIIYNNGSFWAQKCGGEERCFEIAQTWIKIGNIYDNPELLEANNG